MSANRQRGLSGRAGPCYTPVAEITRSSGGPMARKNGITSSGRGADERGRRTAAEERLAGAALELRRRGFRLTPQRLMILELLEQSSGHIAPEDLYRRVHARYPMINRSTIHRTLDMLERLGLVRHGHEADGAARYHLASDVHHVHLVCHRCGHTVDVEDLSFAEPLVRALHQRYGFQADVTHFPISGLCAACAARRPSIPAATGGG